MAFAVLGMVVLVAGILLTGVLIAASRTRRAQPYAGRGPEAGAGGDASWLGAATSDGSDGCAGADAGGCDGGGGGS